MVKQSTLRLLDHLKWNDLIMKHGGGSTVLRVSLCSLVDSLGFRGHPPLDRVTVLLLDFLAPELILTIFAITTFIFFVNTFSN